jgi:hypothetical protein
MASEIRRLRHLIASNGFLLRALAPVVTPAVAVVAKLGYGGEVDHVHGLRQAAPVSNQLTPRPFGAGPCRGATAAEHERVGDSAFTVADGLAQPPSSRSATRHSRPRLRSRIEET